ncbi:MAG: hypothetical protein ACKPDI_01535, partial [Actinomycetota bacterium]
GLWWATNTTVRQRITPTRMLGRMNAAFRMISWGVVPFGAAAGGALARSFGLMTPFRLGAVAMLVIAVSAPRLLRPVAVALRAQST